MVEQAKQFVPDEFSIPSWGNVAGLGIFQWVNQLLNSSLEILFCSCHLKRVNIRRRCPTTP